MDGPVLGAIITASAALAVAIGGGLRRTVRVGIERRYERRQTFLVDAQDAMLDLRQALATYGAALQEELRNNADVSAVAPVPASVLLPGQVGTATPSSFVLGVPRAVSLQVDAARGRLAVARSRVEDERVADALTRWESLAQASKIDPHDTQTSAEEAAFAEVNELIRAALQRPPG